LAPLEPDAEYVFTAADACVPRPACPAVGLSRGANTRRGKPAVAHPRGHTPDAEASGDVRRALVP
jgi:hypothetical protein